jgi:hypothetical protein
MLISMDCGLVPPLTGTLKAPPTFHASWASGLKPQKIAKDVWGDWKIGAMVVRGSKDPNATTYSGARVFIEGAFVLEFLPTILV